MNTGFSDKKEQKGLLAVNLKPFGTAELMFAKAAEANSSKAVPNSMQAVAGRVFTREFQKTEFGK